MRQDFLILADRAEALNGKLYMMGGGFDRVGLGTLPGPASFDLAAGIVVGYHDTNVPIQFQLRCENEDGEPAFPPLDGQLEVGRPPGMVTGQDQRAVIVLRGPFPFERPGSYSWVLSLNGQDGERTRFHVEQVPMPAPPKVGA